jgi:hypothetical protein
VFQRFEIGKAIYKALELESQLLPAKRKLFQATMNLHHIEGSPQKQSAKAMRQYLVEDTGIQLPASPEDKPQSSFDATSEYASTARDGINSIKKSDVVELKSLNNPPVGVMLVAEAICILLHEKTDWVSFKKLLGNLNDFLHTMSDMVANIEQIQLDKK